MGLFDKIFKKEKIDESVKQYFSTLTAYQPVFTSFEGGVYEMELTRAAIHTFATHASKLKPEISGAAAPQLKNALTYRPNPYQDTTKFLYRLATVLAVDNTCFITPLYDGDFETITGFYPIRPKGAEVIEHNEQPFLRFTFADGNKTAIELEKAGILTQHQLNKEFFGESNAPLFPTMRLMDAQNQAIIEGIKSGASVRFLARLAHSLKDEHIKAKRDEIVKQNLTMPNSGGVLMVDNTVADIKPIDSKPFVVSDAQMKVIKDNVYDYFGISENIIRNDFDEKTWAAYYEGKIEPFALQLSLVLTNMTFSPREIEFGNQIFFTSYRLQYTMTETKLEVVTQLFDRGMMTRNQGLEVFNLPPDDSGDGDKYYIRKEYAETTKLDADVPDSTEPQESEEIDDAIQTE